MMFPSCATFVLLFMFRYYSPDEDVLVSVNRSKMR